MAPRASETAARSYLAHAKREQNLRQTPSSPTTGGAATARTDLGTAGGALISVINASAALTQPNAVAAAPSRFTLSAETSRGRGSPLKKVRPPRLPRREPTNFELREVAASGSAADL